MGRRAIPPDLLDAVLQNPQQMVLERDGTKVYQSQIDLGGGTLVLLRAIVVDDVDPAIVVTVYKTNKIDKYWETP